jgi:Fe-S-cluster containining protein
MSLYRKVQAVQKLFSQLEKENDVFKDQTSLKCFSGCFNCCLKPDIFATALEFLPMAYHLYKKGEAEAFLKRAQNTVGPLCLNLSPKEGAIGGCNNYADRGLICRLFGFSAITNKYNKEVLVTCLPIKTDSKVTYDNAVKQINNGLNVPIIMDYYTRLRFIDSDLGSELLPINKAIIKALEVVLWYYTYRTSGSPRRAV